MSTQTTARIPGGMLCHKYNIRQTPPAPTYFTAASTTQTGTVFGLPARHVVCGVRMELITTFSALGLSSCEAMVGVNYNSTSVPNYYAPSFQCVQPIFYDTSLAYWSPLAMYTTDPHDVTVTFISTGANLSTLTAGEIEFTILYRPL